MFSMSLLYKYFLKKENKKDAIYVPISTTNKT